VRIPLSIIALLLLALATRAADRPNILWLTAEDSNPHLGVYGDTFAVTPTLDALAAESVRYTNAFAYTGACSPSRSCLITGVYPMRLGTHHMRSTTLYAMATDPRRNPFEKLQRAADLANAMEPRHLDALAALLRDDDPAVRWWGVTGLLALGADAAPARPALLTALDDSSPDVRITAAETLARLGVVDRALPVLEAALQLDKVFIRLAALNAALRLGPAARPLLPAIHAAKISAPAQKDTADYVGRMVEYLPARLGH
jgi:hypothetical protein